MTSNYYLVPGRCRACARHLQADPRDPLRGRCVRPGCPESGKWQPISPGWRSDYPLPLPTHFGPRHLRKSQPAK